MYNNHYKMDVKIFNIFSIGNEGYNRVRIYVIEVEVDRIQ